MWAAWSARCTRGGKSQSALVTSGWAPPPACESGRAWRCCKNKEAFTSLRLCMAELLFLLHGVPREGGGLLGPLPCSQGFCDPGCFHLVLPQQGRWGFPLPRLGSDTSLWLVSHRPELLLRSVPSSLPDMWGPWEAGKSSVIWWVENIFAAMHNATQSSSGSRTGRQLESSRAREVTVAG